MTDGARQRRQPAEDWQMGMNIESCCTESSNKWTGERRYRVMEVKQYASSGAEKGNEQKGGECLALPTFSRHGKVQVNLTLLIWLIENVALLTLRAWTQMGKEIKG